MGYDLETCAHCDRLHNKDKPCPKRVAEAMQMEPGALHKLTTADIAIMAEDFMRGYNVVWLIEEDLANNPLFG